MLQSIRGADPFAPLKKMLTSRCADCRGLCCTVLYFSRSEGFPCDKPPGLPCPNLAEDFRCRIHSQLAARGLRGCMAFDCMGAGQRASRFAAGGEDTDSALANLFLVMRRLHQMLWYLTDAGSLLPAFPLLPRITALVEGTLRLSGGQAQELLALNGEGGLAAHKTEVDGVLREVISLTRHYVLADRSAQPAGKKDFTGADLMGKNWRGRPLDGFDLSASLLIAANLERCSLRGVSLLGADLRDANIRDADLSQCLFLTMEQLASAKGGRGTKLPPRLAYPNTWG